MIGMLVAILAGVTEITTGIPGIYDRVSSFLESPIATPMPFSKEAPGESLIIVAQFDRAAGIPDSRPHEKIVDAIRSAINELDIENVRVEALSDIIPSQSGNIAEEIGKLYGATTVIWGEETSVDIRVSLLNRREMWRVNDIGTGRSGKVESSAGIAYVQPDNITPSKGVLPIHPLQPVVHSPLLIPTDNIAVSFDDGTYVTTNTDPQDYIELITSELPDQITFFALLPIAQVQLFNGNDRAALDLLEKALASRRDELSDDDIGEVFRQTARLHLSIAHRLMNTWGDGVQGQVIEHAKVAKLRLNQAVESGLTEALTYYFLASANHFAGEDVQALHNLDVALAQGPDDHLRVFILNNRAVTKIELGDDQGALADIAELVQLDPSAPSSYTLRSGIRFRQGDYLGAIADADKNVELQGLAATAVTRPDVLDFQAQAYIALGRYDEAVEVYENLVDMGRPENRAYAEQRLKEARVMQNP